MQKLSSFKCRLRARYAHRSIAAGALSVERRKDHSKYERLVVDARAASIKMIGMICQSFIIARSRRGHRHGGSRSPKIEPRYGSRISNVGEVQPEHAVPRSIIDTVQT